MSNEIETTTPETAPVIEEMTGAEYIAAIEQMRRDMVPRDTYEKLRSEHRTLINDYASGKYYNQPDTPPPTISEMCETLFSKASLAKIGNCEYAETTLALRDALIESGAADPFVSSDLANLMEHCLDVANGNDKVFAAEFEAHLTEDIAVSANGAKPKSARRW